LSGRARFNPEPDSMPTNTADYELAAERRQVVAMGASPWNAVNNSRRSPSGATRDGVRCLPVAPLGLGNVSPDNHGLTPVATACRPVGTETQQRVSRSGGVSLPSCVFWEARFHPEPDSVRANTIAADYDFSREAVRCRHVCQPMECLADAIFFTRFRIC